jgi:hypothetical protein
MQTNAPSLGSVTLTYIAFFLGLAVVMNALAFAIEYFGSFQFNTNSFGWLPLLLGALMAGQSYGSKAGGKPPQGFSWMAGLIFLIVSLAISIVALYLFALIFGFETSGIVTQLRAEIGGDMGLFVGIMAGVLLFIWVLLRFAFSMGAGQGAKQAEMRGK